MSVIVTGATSMIGVSLLEELIKGPEIDTIYAVVHPLTKKYFRVPQDKRIVRIDLDIDEYEKLPELISTPCSCFYHLAWVRTQTYEETADDMLIKCRCIAGVIKAVEAAHKTGCSKFIWAGSQSEYGLISGRLGPETPCSPVRADGIAHLAAGNMGKILAEKHGMAFIWMRIFSIYGKYDRPNSMISSTIKKLMTGEHCSFSPAEQLWDYLNAADAGCAFCMVGRKVSRSAVYCVGSGEEHPLREYIEIMRDIIDPDAVLGIGELQYPKDPVMRLCADNSSLTKDTGWRPSVSFEEGIKSIITSINDQTI